MVYLLVIKKQFHLQCPHPAFSRPGFCLEQLAPGSVPQAYTPELAVRPGFPDPSIMDPGNETVVITASLELAQGPDVSFGVFFHNGFSVADLDILFNPFYGLVNANISQ